MLLLAACCVAFQAPHATTSLAAPLNTGAVGLLRTSQAIRMEAPTKAQKLVRERLNPRADINTMSESEVRKYAYAMQIEVQRLIAEENAAKELRENLQLLLDDASAGCLVREGNTSLSPAAEAALIAAMKVEGLVRYGLVYATAKTSWDSVRDNHSEFAAMSDQELYEAFKSTGRGISGTYGDLF